MRKTSVLIFVMFLTVFAFGQNETEETRKKQMDIYYFHRTQRCQTCLSIEENINKTLNTQFADEVAGGKIVLHSLDYQGEAENEFVTKYNIDGPTLLLVKTKKEKETVKDLTDFAFENSLHQGEKFREGLESKINEFLR
ncbi:MAG: nitrophenyl compound nitroreductase subunit ArsF family protein [Bacteroidales bacterium]|nr:nitrophenyl compound nitroreductase subunit ArsF family protein [Bacteroidales bacterium]MCF8405795.1 nitrophenyl compound nitroreductase subunit ArsF family protein [Bacteroidales bacterium]